MKILISPDKFKGTLSAREVADNIAAGLREILTNAEIDIVPMADGGEGTAEVISQALGASWVKCEARDPIGQGRSERLPRRARSDGRRARWRLRGDGG